MVRAGIVRHHESWPHCGYREIECPPKRYRIINQSALLETCQFESYADLQSAHQSWIPEALQKEESKYRNPEWTESVAVGQRDYIELIQQALGIRASGRQIIDLESGYQLKEATALYGTK